MPLDLSALDAITIPPTATRRLAVPEIGATLILRPATEENREFWSAAISSAAASAQLARLRGGGAPTPEVITDERRREIDIYADHVVVGWEGVKRTDGSPADCTPEAVRELLTAIVERAPRIWSRIDRFAATADNFTARALADASALAGNSPGG